LNEPTVILESFGRGDHNRSFTFQEFQSEVIADCVDDVQRALQDVDSATRNGMHAAGFVTYEASPGLDEAYKCVSQKDALPLVWFGLFRNRTEVDPGDIPDDYRDERHTWDASVTRSGYEKDLTAIRSYIAAGDSYQVNHTFRMSSTLAGDGWAFYRALCRSQKANYCAYIDTGRHQVLSASPELFFSLKDGCLTTRPMKGTHRRGRWTEEDDRFAAELARSEKNRAENLMIVDLLRNDLGRVAETGSVEVRDLWNVEAYETLFQMTSTVEARVRDDVDLPGLFRALFPCGSVTGAPKVRTMQIISELEAEPRGVYTGAIGYVSPGQEATFNVAIRTVTVEQETARAEFGVGGGITWDSTSEDEYQECLTKARVLTERRPDFYLFETVRFDPEDGVYLWDRHIERITQSARYFGFPCNPTLLGDELSKATDQIVEPSRVRLILRSDGSVSAESAPLGPSSVDGYLAAVCPLRVDSSNVFLYHKTSHRDVYDQCLASCPGVDDVILVNERGELTETRIGNLVLEIDGQRVTPPISSGLLGGTFRAELLARGQVAERTLCIDDLQGAQNVFMVNSVREWVPVTVVPDATSVDRAAQTTLSAGS
jgi:para-aminobenzoate synthetase/4-amino-4-deoxychorismate lyase